MKLKTHSLKKDCDIIIDFGDDSERLVVRTAEIGTNGLKKYDESSWESYSECIITINHIIVKHQDKKIICKGENNG